MKFNAGTENFAEYITSGAYYVDKTAYLKTLFMSSAEVKNALFIRPRRFGKTLNLSMIKEFCELNYQNPGDKTSQQKLFIDNGRSEPLAVAGAEYKELREKIMGQFPVISVSFKGVEGSNFSAALSSMLRNVAELYEKFLFLTRSSAQHETDKRNLQQIYDFCKTMHGKLTQEDNLTEAVSICGSFVPTLAQMLHKEYQKQVIVIIDEYDVPLQKAVIAKEPYYDEMLSIIRQLSVSTFKQQPDPWLYKGIISGCLRIAHQSVFTDANNFTTFGMNREPYTGFFGFTQEETEKLLFDCGLTAKGAEVRQWYDGYRFGKQRIYCPWSLMSYCDQALHGGNDIPQPFWANTSGNDLITLFTQNSMEAHEAGNLAKLQQLLDAEKVVITPKEFTTYPDLSQGVSFDVFMTLMLHTGYVTYAEDNSASGRISICIPNREIKECFLEKYAYLYSEDNPYWYNQAKRLIELLLTNQIEEVQSLLSSMLKQFISIRNSGSELYYHGFMLGVLGLAAASRSIELKSEVESGDGFTDLILKQGQTAVVIELKKGENSPRGRLKACEAAQAQILKQGYVRGMLDEGYSNVYGLGIGFGGKDCIVKSLGNLAGSNQLSDS